MAAIWKLLIIFLCENNLSAITGCVKDTLNICDISIRSQSFGIPGITINGNDIFEVCSVTREARERALFGEGPSLIESKTYRWLDHWHADPCRYREGSEVEEWKKKYPIKRLKKYLLDQDILTEFSPHVYFIY